MLRLTFLRPPLSRFGKKGFQLHIYTEGGFSSLGEEIEAGKECLHLMASLMMVASISLTFQ